MGQGQSFSCSAFSCESAASGQSTWGCVEAEHEIITEGGYNLKQSPADERRLATNLVVFQQCVRLVHSCRVTYFEVDVSGTRLGAQAEGDLD